MWNNRSTIHNLIDVGKRFTFDDFVEYSHNFLKSGKHLWFGIGNIRADPEMIRIAKTVKEIMNTQPLKIEDMYPIRILKLAPNIELYSQIEVEDEENTISSAIVCHFQYGYSKSMENDILYQILFQIIDEPTFDFLRTQEQLGYLAYSKSWLFRSVRGGGFVIQSSNK